MIDPTTEKLCTLNAARRLPWMKGRAGNSVSLCAMVRWTKNNGVGGVVLETLKIGGTIFTSEEATLRFIERLNNKENQVSRPIVQRRRQIERAEKRLDQAGI